VSDGLEDGELVGLNLTTGFFVGLVTSDSVGCLVGDVVIGFLDIGSGTTGDRVGDLVGVEVTRFVGPNVGLVVELIVGGNVGESVGMSVSSIVVVVDGTDVGAIVILGLSVARDDTTAVLLSTLDSFSEGFNVGAALKGADAGLVTGLRQTGADPVSVANLKNLGKYNG
jgi:hypothetical protein